MSSAPTESFDIPLEVAEIYEARFVPAIFAHWAPVTLDAAEVEAADHLLDVACGTGIVARTALARRTESEATGLGTGTGAITGVDLNPAMLTVARRQAPEIEWRQGDVAALPLADDSVDVAVSQMAAMFFPDQRAAMAEMARVVRPGGRLAWVVPSSLSEQPAYEPFVDAAATHVGDDARSLLGAYWACGDRAAFTADLEAVGLERIAARARAGIARFDSPADFVATEIDATPLVDRIDDGQRRRIVADVTERLAAWVEPGKPFDIPLVGNVVSARVPG
ncbi:MAG: class I SAM-dependent methyltransferase [Actinomycetota bacterium]